MLRTSVIYSCGLHLTLVLFLWVCGQQALHLKSSGGAAPIVAQVVSSQVLLSQIAAVEKSHESPVRKAVLLKKTTPILPPKKVVTKPTRLSPPPAIKPQTKRRVAAKPVTKITPPPAASKVVDKSPPTGAPSLPTFTIEEREQLMQGAVDKEDDAYQVALREEAARIGYEIKRVVSANWLIPVGRSHDLACQVKILLDYRGQVQQVVITKSSGSSTFDNAAVSAVRRSSPLPMPQDTRLVTQFREILLTLSPDGIV